MRVVGKGRRGGTEGSDKRKCKDILPLAFKAH